MTEQTNKPTMILYHTQEYRKGGEAKTRWNRIGAAWKHQDGHGFNIKLEYLPITTDGNLVLREPLPEDKE